MTDALTGNATRPQPTPVDLSGIDPRHPDHEDTLQLLGTTIAETAAGVTGVHHLGGVAARSLDRARRKVVGTSNTPGVNVAVEADTTFVDLDIVVEYPHPVDRVITTTREQVTHAAAQIVTRLIVVDITVTDIHGPFDNDPAILDAIDAAGEKVDALKTRATDVAAAVSDKAVELGEQAADTLTDAAESRPAPHGRDA